MSTISSITHNKLEKLTRTFISTNFLYTKNTFIFLTELHNRFKGQLYDHYFHGKNVELDHSSWTEADTQQWFSTIFFKKKPVPIKGYYSLGWYHIELISKYNRINLNKKAVLNHFLDITLKYERHANVSVHTICVNFIKFYVKHINKDNIWSKDKIIEHIMLRYNDLTHLTMVPYKYEFIMYKPSDEKKRLKRIVNKSKHTLVKKEKMNANEIIRKIKVSQFVMDTIIAKREKSLFYKFRKLKNLVIEDIVRHLIGKNYHKINMAYTMKTIKLIGTGKDVSTEINNIRSKNAYWKAKLSGYLSLYYGNNEGLNDLLDHYDKLESIMEYVLISSTNVYINPLLTESSFIAICDLLVDNTMYIILNSNTLKTMEKKFLLRIQLCYAMLKRVYRSVNKIGIIFINSKEVVVLDMSKWTQYKHFIPLLDHCVSGGSFIDYVKKHNLIQIAPMNIPVKRLRI